MTKPCENCGSTRHKHCCDRCGKPYSFASSTYEPFCTASCRAAQRAENEASTPTPRSRKGPVAADRIAECTAAMFVELLIEAAGNHACMSDDPDHEVGDLHTALRVIWGSLTFDQQTRLMRGMTPSLKEWL